MEAVIRRIVISFSRPILVVGLITAALLASCGSIDESGARRPEPNNKVAALKSPNQSFETMGCDVSSFLPDSFGAITSTAKSLIKRDLEETIKNSLRGCICSKRAKNIKWQEFSDNRLVYVGYNARAVALNRQAVDFGYGVDFVFDLYNHEFAAFRYKDQSMFGTLFRTSIGASMGMALVPSHRSVIDVWSGWFVNAGFNLELPLELASAGGTFFKSSKGDRFGPDLTDSRLPPEVAVGFELSAKVGLSITGQSLFEDALKTVPVVGTIAAAAIPDMAYAYFEPFPELTYKVIADYKNSNPKHAEFLSISKQDPRAYSITGDNYIVRSLNLAKMMVKLGINPGLASQALAIGVTRQILEEAEDKSLGMYHYCKQN